MSMNVGKSEKLPLSIRLKKPAKYVRLGGGKLASLASKSHMLINAIGPQVASTVQKVQMAGLAIGAVGLVGTGYEIYSNIKDIHHAKGRVKLIPSLLLMTNFGSIAGYCGQLAGLITAKLKLAGAALSHAGTAITALGVAAIGLQLVKLTIDVVELRTLFKASKKFERKMSTEIKGVRSIFRVFTKQQKERIEKTKEFGNTVKLQLLVKERFTYLKKMKALSIAIGVIAIVGVVLASFSPPPLCFIGWAVIGATLVAAIGRAIHVGLQDRRFNRELGLLSGDVVSPEQEIWKQKMLEREKLQEGYYTSGRPYAP